MMGRSRNLTTTPACGSGMMSPWVLRLCYFLFSIIIMFVQATGGLVAES
jgi:hypothetical protein